MRTFTVCANLTCSSFQSVTATATTVGTHIAIYVDNLAPKPGLNSADLDTLKQEFDSQLCPLVRLQSRRGVLFDRGRLGRQVELRPQPGGGQARPAGHLHA